MNKSLKKIIAFSVIVNIAISLKLTYIYAVSSYSDGWNNRDGKWMYVEAGKFKTKWFKDKDGSWYYFNNDGVMQTGWVLDDGNWYYLYENGSMAHGCYIGDYYLNDSGSWTESIPHNNKNDNNIKDLNLEIKKLGYSSEERIIDPYSSSDKYSSLYRYIWCDGKEENSQYATVNVFDSGSCSILIRKNSTAFDENLKKIFNIIAPGYEDELFNKVKNTTEEEIKISGRDIKIMSIGDEIGIEIN